MRPPTPFPPAARLLHIGLPKTGTTALQAIASARRAELLELGVRYPGGGVNHREAVSALMGRRWGWIGPGAAVPSMRHWTRLMTEAEADPRRRLWISHEFAAESDDVAAAKFVDALGERLQVVVTLRPFGAVLVSSWQQYLKGGTSHTFERWLRAVLADPPETRVTPSFHLRNDQGAVVRRWAAAAGTNRVTAVVVDKADPHLLTDAFEGLLDLPAGFLRTATLDGSQTNRSLSASESELLRRVNHELKGHRVDWGDYETLLREGGIARLLAGRTPGVDEPVLRLPAWAAARASALGARYAAEIGASGVRVLGDLEVLGAPVPGTGERVPVPCTVDFDVAVQLVVGTLAAALGRGAFFDAAPPPVRGQVRDLRTRELAGEVLARVARTVRRRLPGR